MSVNLLEKVQQNLGYAPLHKIDPNNAQEVTVHNEPQYQFAQAAIPAVLTALYKYV
jgi:predicted ArsR family transcriptional regulator